MAKKFKKTAIKMKKKEKKFKKVIFLSLREVYRFIRHCEEQSDVAIQRGNVGTLDCFVASLLAITNESLFFNFFSFFPF